MAAETGRQPIVDIRLHDLVQIRLVDAHPADLAAVRRQLGPWSPSTGGLPDLAVRFVDRLAVGPLTYAGWPETGYDAERFVLLRGLDGTPGRAQIDFDRIGERPEIICERRLGRVPHLVALLNLTVLGKGVLPLHATAFEIDGRGVLVTGWAKGGKTELLLAMSRLGARYIGDEWVYLGPDGSMVGIPEPIRLWHWHLRQMGDRSPVTGHRARLVVAPAVARALERWGDEAAPSGWLGKASRRVGGAIGRQAYVQVPPDKLFGTDGVLSRGRFDHLVLAVSDSRSDVSVREVDAAEVAARMRASLEDERSRFLAHYRQFLFAFPHRRCELVDTAARREEALLSRTLVGRPAHELRHPYPVDLRALVQPVLGAIRGQGVAADEPEFG